MSAAALAASLTLHLAGEGLALYAPHAARWYVKSDTPMPVSDAPPALAVGHDIKTFAPAKGGKQVQRLLTELQMLLHAPNLLISILHLTLYQIVQK